MDQYIGEIRIFAGTYAPAGWLFCNGQSLNVSDYDTLYALIGNTYGGNTTSFNVPDFRGRIPVSQGHGPGLSYYNLGDSCGDKTVTLTNEQQLAQHKHSFNAENHPATTNEPEGHIIGNYDSEPIFNYYKAPPLENYVTMNEASISYTGSNEPHDNMQPYLSLSFIISYTGEWPPRT